MQRVQITHHINVPDPIKVARYRTAPHLGPRLLFFTGGTALKTLSQELLSYTHNSIHIITPFDSGGSSAEIRKHFNMLGVGDLRNRLMALADRSLQGNPQIFDLFAYRLPKDAEPADLRERLRKLIDGKDPLITRIHDPMRKLIRSHLRFFSERMPDNFELRGASIGNLILTGGYFNYNRHIDPVIYLFSKLVEARGIVRPVINMDLHLAAELADGSVIPGQHNITGKEATPLASPIKRLFLTRERDPREDGAPCEEAEPPVVRRKVSDLIKTAEIICYPMGSFYSSVIANLLPRGVGSAIAETNCPKVYVPNLGNDPEMVGMGLFDAVRTLLSYLEKSCNQATARDRLLNFLLIDTKRGKYPQPLHLDKIRRFGVEILDVEMVSEHSAPYLDPNKVIEHVLSLV
ncbi:GAK system CofD-like protein [Megalodesulfovibrio paquesii]